MGAVLALGSLWLAAVVKWNRPQRAVAFPDPEKKSFSFKLSKRFKLEGRDVGKPGHTQYGH
jgi:hypothetical protein